MIASWIAKRMVQTGFDVMKQDDFDVAAMMKQWADDAVYDVGTELGIGETIKGKKAISTHGILSNRNTTGRNQASFHGSGGRNEAPHSGSLPDSLSHLADSTVIRLREC